MTQTRLIYMGGVVVDLVYRIGALPAPGAEVVASGWRAEAAGGFNTMAAARRSGMAVAYGGHYGAGCFGTMIQKALDEEDIARLQAASPAADSGSCVVLVTADAERTFVYAPGCEFALDAEAVARVRPDPADWVLVSGYALAEESSGAAVADWLARIDEHARVVFDPSPLVGNIAADVLARVLRRTTWLTCNAAEAAALSGMAEPRAAAETLTSSVCRQAEGILLRMSAAGCLLRTADGTTRHIPARQTAAIDTTGAGDAHTGAFIAAMASGATPEAAAERANAAAAISVTRPGGASAPFHHEIMEFLESQRMDDAGPPDRHAKFPTGSVAPHLGE
ncbi:MAG: PfkB family carbohydrate kinase [Pseudomonadota bacterium]|nr:PfkB family carbohydrate kinase [Pseudomonadota bacterium]